jgi:hypothetical protein
LIASVGVGVWAYFGIIERLNNVETNYILMQSDVEKNSTFSRDWPLGRAGSLPQDSEQYMLIEFISKELTQLKHNIETGKAPYDQQQALTLEFYEKRINGLESKMEKLKDEVAELKANNGH